MASALSGSSGLGLLLSHPVGFCREEPGVNTIKPMISSPCTVSLNFMCSAFVFGMTNTHWRKPEQSRISESDDEQLFKEATHNYFAVTYHYEVNIYWTI